MEDGLGSIAPAYVVLSYKDDTLYRLLEGTGMHTNSVSSIIGYTGRTKSRSFRAMLEKGTISLDKLVALYDRFDGKLPYDREEVVDRAEYVGSRNMKREVDRDLVKRHLKRGARV